MKHDLLNRLSNHAAIAMLVAASLGATSVQAGLTYEVVEFRAKGKLRAPCSGSIGAVCNYAVTDGGIAGAWWCPEGNTTSTDFFGPGWAMNCSGAASCSSNGGPNGAAAGCVQAGDLGGDAWAKGEDIACNVWNLIASHTIKTVSGGNHVLDCDCSMLLSYAVANSKSYWTNVPGFDLIYEVRRSTSGGSLRDVASLSGSVSRNRTTLLINDVVAFEQEWYSKGGERTGMTGTYVPELGGEHEVRTIAFDPIEGEAHIEIRNGSVQDNAYDFNHDGQFDADDVAWVRNNFREIDINEYPYPPAVPENVDLGDGELPQSIDENDAVFLEKLLDHVGASPLLGDFNKDGLIDCRDSFGSSAFFGPQVGDTDYRYELDFNSDGVVDNDDKIAFFARVNHCDFNQDEIVEDADFVIFAAAYNLLDCEDPGMPAYCPADLNLDGFVDGDDFAIFVIRYTAGTC